MRNIILNLFISALCATRLSGGTLEEATQFFDAYCIDCHSEDSHTAGLNLEGIAFTAAQKQNTLNWEAVFDKVKSGQMPPETEAQPEPSEKEKFLKSLEVVLRDASLQRQKMYGRAPVRRLTRAEYENTVRELLHIGTGLKEMFPDDGVTAGFNKVGEGLTLSATHFERYQEAADKALAEATLRTSPLIYSEDGPALFKRRQENFTNYGNWVEGKSMVLTSRLFYPYTAIITPWAPRSGRYRIRITAQARNSDGKLLPLGIGIHDHKNNKPDGPDLSTWFDIPETEPRTVTAELDLKLDESFHVFGVTLAHRDAVLPLHKKGERWTKSMMLIEKIEVEGPLNPDGSLDTWPSRSYRELFDDLPMKQVSEITQTPVPKGSPNPWVPISNQPKVDAERLLRRFLPKAFRRPVPEAIAASYVAGVLKAMDDDVPFHTAMFDAYKAVLCSPNFLLLDESPGLLDGPALANRLAYFLWDGPPDDELMQAAIDGELSHSEGRFKQVERLLNDPRSARFETSFTNQWLDLQKINDTSPDSALYPEFDSALQLSALSETRQFFHTMLADNLSLHESIQSNWTYLNEPLAALYGLPAVSGHELRKTTLPPDSRRGGFLTQSSILKVTADGAKTSPILRGKWVNEKILGIVPPPPPDDVAKIEPDIRGATTIRVQLEKHRNTPACASCHVILDPPGFALETFDVIGGWRDFYRVPQDTGQKIDVAGTNKKVNRGAAVEMGYTMPDGRPFADIDAYKTLLLEDKDGIAFALASKLLTYATGTTVQFADRDDLTDIVHSIRKDHYGLRSLVHAIVNSRPFLNK